MEDQLAKLIAEAKDRLGKQATVESEEDKAARLELEEFRKSVESQLTANSRALLRISYGKAANAQLAAQFQYKGSDYIFYRGSLMGNWTLEKGPGQIPPGKSRSVAETKDPQTFTDLFLVGLDDLDSEP
jgi:hypothetical protein